MKYSPRRFTALLLALIMVLSVAPLDALASVFTTYEADIIIDTSEPVQISEALVTSKVTSKDGFSVVVSSIDEDILPAKGWVGFEDKGAKGGEEKTDAAEPEAEETQKRGAAKRSVTPVKSAAPVVTRREIGRYDITVYDANGKEWQPETGETVDVRVRLSTPLDLNAGEKLILIHNPGPGESAVPATFYKNTDGQLTGFAFEADGFSIYAVVTEGTDARMKVIFSSNGTEIASMLVKQRDAAENAVPSFDTVVYDPGTGTLPDDVIFLGWTDNPDYTLPMNTMSIAQVRDDIKTILDGGITDFEAEGGTTKTYYAVLAKQFTIDYLDDKEVSVGQDVVEYRADATAPEIPYTVNMTYSPDDTHAFMGWNVHTGKDHIKNYVEGTVYENDTHITVTGDVVFSVEAPEGHWLVFDENGKGGKYNAPQFRKTGELTEKPCPDSEMTRFGYSFGGWYTDKACTTAFTFGRELTDNITIYAKWLSNTEAPYTVIFWTQNEGRTGYDVKDSVVVEDGQVGQNIPYTFVDNQDEDYVDGYNGYGHYTGFCLTEASKNQEVEITPEGDAVLNLKYDRIVYNFKFYLYRDGNNGGYDYANNSGNGSSLNDLVTWHSNQNAHPSVTGHTILSETSGGRTYHYFVMEAYYGENIANKWPKYGDITGANGREAVSFVMMVGTVLKPNPTNQGSGTVKGVVTVLNENILGKTNNANGNYVMIRFPDSYYNWRYHIWFETVTGEDYTGKTLHTYNGKTYYEETVLTVRSSNTTDANQNEPKYPGFTYITRLGQNDSGTVWQGGHWTTGRGTSQDPTLYHLNYVYDREQYKISYFDGNYVDGDGNQIQNRASHLLHESPEIGQGAQITDEYKNYKPTLPEGQEGFVFDGWYLDEGCTKEYEFTTMAVGGIQVYAKWVQIQYRVFLHSMVPTDDTTLYWGSESQKMNFRISYNGTVSAPTGTRTGYEFGGWYTNPDYNGVYNAGNYRLNESTVTTPYNQTTHFTDPHTKYDGDGTSTNSDYDNNRTWITKEFNLYAKWTMVLDGADGIGVVYDLNGGTGTAEDSNLYKDKAKAVAQPAVTAPEGQVFSHWVVQKWNGTAFEDTATIVYPGKNPCPLMRSWRK